MYGREYKKEETFYSLKPQLASIDDPIISCSDSYWAIPYQGGGGPVYVSRLTDYGKVLPECATLNAQKAPVLCTAFSPFHSGLLATGSSDCTTAVWNLDLYDSYGDDGAAAAGPLSQGISAAGDTVQPVVSFNTHTNSVRTCAFHPTVPSMLVTTSLDATVRYFDVNAGSKDLSLVFSFLEYLFPINTKH